MADIYINYGTNLQKMTMELMETAKINEKINPSMRIGIKPNLVVSRRAEEGATTHPEIVEGIISYLQAQGCNDISIMEGSWVGDSTQSAFVNCGYTDLAHRYQVKLIDTKRDRVIRVKEGDITLSLCESVVNVDYLINVPVLKGHCQTGMTCCIKNLKGCIPDSEKRRFHTMGLHKPIAALGKALLPALHIVDSVCGDLSFEEGGNPVTANRIMLGFDPVLLDSYGAGLIGFLPDEIEYLRLAKKEGSGKYADETTTIVELNAEHRPKVSLGHSGKMTKYRKMIEEDSACSACYASLIYALDKAGGRRNDIIKIGQGFQGKTLNGIGVGNCTAGCESYVKGCPPKASDIIAYLEKKG